MSQQVSTLNGDVFNSQSGYSGINRNSLLSEGNISRQRVKHHDSVYGQKERNVRGDNVAADSRNH